MEHTMELDNQALLSAVERMNRENSRESREAVLDLVISYDQLCRDAIAKGAQVTKLFEIPAREKIGRAKSVPVEEYPTAYAQIRQEMEQEIAAVSAQGGEF